MNSIATVTMGDPTGTGPEITIKSLSEAELADALVMVVSCVHMLRHIMAMNITPQTELYVVQKVRNTHFAPGVINVMDEPLANPDALTPEMVQAAAGDLACRHIEYVTALTLSGEARTITTAPLNKEALHLGGYNYPGHTGLLTHPIGSKDYVMALYTGKFRVIHIPTHISLRKFLDILSGERIKTVIRVANRFPKHADIECPRIAMAGVNPHTGEHGLFGTEEIETIASMIEAM